MKDVYERIDTDLSDFEKDLDDRELETLYLDALWDFEGDRAKDYPEGSVMLDIIEGADTVEGTDFLNRLRDEISRRNQGKGRWK